MIQGLLRRSLLIPCYCYLVGSFVIRAPNQHALRLPVYSSSRTWTWQQTARSVSAAAIGGEDEAPPSLSREQLVERTLKKIADGNAKAELMKEVRKEKRKRHKRLQVDKLQGIDEDARALKKAREESAEQRLLEAFAVDEGRTPPLVDLPPRLRLAFDLAYGESESQLKSLGRQLSMVYGLMRKTAMGEEGHAGTIPSIHLTSATPEMVEVLRVHGGQAWAVHRHEAPVFDVFQRHSLVYLSPDSPNVLTQVDESKVYVIGGLVDRMILKGRSLGRANQHQVATARLPLKEFFTKVPNGGKYLSSQCLAVDRVAQILMLVHGLQQQERAMTSAEGADGGRSANEGRAGQGHYKDSSSSGDPWEVALTRVFLGHTRQQHQQQPQQPEQAPSQHE